MEAFAHRERDVDLVGIQRHAARHQCDLVEAVGSAGPPPDADLQSGALPRLLPGDVLTGLESGLLQGVLTPMNGAGSANYTRALSFNRGCIARSSTCPESPTTTSADCARRASGTRTSSFIAHLSTSTASVCRRGPGSARAVFSSSSTSARCSRSRAWTAGCR